MAHVKNTLTLAIAALIFTGCYTQVKVMEERPDRRVADRYEDTDRYTEEEMTDQEIYDLGYEDAVHDMDLRFRDYERYRWSASFGLGYGYRPFYSHYPRTRWSFGFSYGYDPFFYYDWGWHSPWHYHYSPWHYHYSWYGTSRFHRYPAYGWGMPAFYGPNYFIVYNYRTVTGLPSDRVRTTRDSGSVTGTRAATVARDATRSTAVRSSEATRTITRSGETAVNRGTTVTRSGTTGTTVRSDPGTTTTRSTGTVTRRPSSSGSSGTVTRSPSSTSRSSGSVSRSSSSTSRSSGTVTRSSGSTSRSSGSVSRSSSSSSSRSSSSSSSRSSSSSSSSRSRD